MKNPALKFLTPAIACLCLGLLPNNTKAANSEYFNTALTSGGTYSWDSTSWGNSGGPYTVGWTNGDFARFSAATTYTVTVANDEQMAGLFDTTSSGNVTINATGSGDLDIVPNTTQDGFGPTQAFLTDGTTTINAPIVGTGGIEEESGGGHLQLYGNNTYSGGTLFTSSSTFVDYNNNNSFGTGNIGFYNTTFSLFENMGASTVNLGNNIQILGSTTGVDFIGNGVTMSGNWNLGGFAVNIRNNGPGAPTSVTLAGVLSNTTGAVTFSGANGGTIHLANANTYTGTTIIGSSGDTAITVSLDAAGALGKSSSIVLGGGTLMPTVNQTMVGTLGLTASSTIDFNGGTLSFANSSALTWSGKLDLANWDDSDDLLQIGTDDTGLTAAQLADIEFDGDSTSQAAINAEGFIYEVPEPSTIALSLVGGLGIFFLRRKKA